MSTPSPVHIPSSGSSFRAVRHAWQDRGAGMNLLILVVADEPDVEMLFRAHFRRDLREGRFTMEFAQSGETALQRIADAAGVSLILILSDINMPGMTGLELLPKAKAARPDVPVIMITGTSGRIALALGNISRPVIPGILMSDRIRMSDTPAASVMRSS